MNEEKGNQNETAQNSQTDSASDLDREIQAGEWQRLNEFPSYGKRSRQGKIIATYQAISNRLNQIVQLYYQLVRNNPEKSLRLLAEIKKLRFLQSFLLDCLIWEEKGELENHKVPTELEDLI